MKWLGLWNVEILEASQALLENPVNTYHKYFPLHM